VIGWTGLMAMVLLAALAGSTHAQEGTWAFEPGRDYFRPDALLDLRSMNENVAGEHGFIGLSEDGSNFVRGDGQPIRFWAVNTGAHTSSIEGLLEDHARFLAKRGVNMVRFHGNITPKGDDQAMTDFDARTRDRLWKFVAAMKKEGIYMTASPYWAASVQPKPGWTSPREGTNMTGLLFFDPELQRAYKEWLRAMYVPVNPYTGIALKDDPAMAIIQIQNEDSLLFWSVGAITGANLDLISRKYAEWLTAKYGTLAAAGQAWDGAAVNGDDLTNGLPRFINIWEMTEDGFKVIGRPVGGKEVRIADQLAFWTETMRDFNAEIVRFLREEIGARQLVNAGNWKSADPVLLEDAERYSYTSTEVLATNRYIGDTHIGEFGGWAIVNGDKFQDRSVLVKPNGLPINLKQATGHPMMVTESSWTLPRAYESEGPFLISVFQSLTGVDAYYWFAFGGAVDARPVWPNPSPQWREPTSANGYMPSLVKWAGDTPEVLGNFPAAAILYRMGYVQQGRPVVQERRSLEDMWHLRVPIIAEEGSYDPNRDKGDFPPQSSIKQDVDRLAFLVGPVEVTYGEDSSASQAADLSDYIDRDAQVVKSVTGEVVWDYGKGVCALSAPKAQGATGFLNKAGTIELGTVRLQSGNDYASVLVVSMDDQPLASSGKILVQAGTLCRPTGWQQKPVTWQDAQGSSHEGFEVVSYGKPPWRVVANDLTVTVANAGVTGAFVLDMSGMPRGQVPLAREGGAVTFRMPRDAKYVILQAE
jgi:hypothetical protein